MSTIWDRAVRAMQPLFAETDQHGHPLAYFCGGPERRCAHRTCDVVCALAAADLLNYPPDEAAPVVGKDDVEMRLRHYLGTIANRVGRPTRDAELRSPVTVDEAGERVLSELEQLRHHLGPLEP